MIVRNPMAEPDAIYVYHSQQPRFLAKYTPGAPMSDFKIMDDIDDMAAFFGNDADKIAGLMRRLGDWFVAENKYQNGK